MHMANYVSRRLNIVCLIFKIRTFFITTFFAWLFVRIYILPICDKSCMTASFDYTGKLYASICYYNLCFKVENRAVIYMCVWCIYCLCAIFLLYFGTVPRVWYFFNCPDSVIFLELFRQCDTFLTVQAVWYFFNCSDSVIFVALFRQCDICCLSLYPSPGTYSALLRSVQ